MQPGLRQHQRETLPCHAVVYLNVAGRAIRDQIRAMHPVMRSSFSSRVSRDWLRDCSRSTVTTVRGDAGCAPLVGRQVVADGPA